jgi:sporulation protein YlmC with PRC-barrel domain
MNDSAPVLVRLADTDQIVADPDLDVRGRTVVTPDGEEIGKVADLLIDPNEGKVRMLRLEHGGVLGIGATSSFVPVEAIEQVTENAVRIDESRDRVAGSPRYDPELADQNEYYTDVYGYYGYAPYWGSRILPPPRGR